MPYRLTLNDVDPLRIAFAPRGIKELVGPLIPGKGTKGYAWEDEITKVLVSRFGPCASGWRWAVDEGSIGGGG
jgi:hypothetical protein